MSLRLPSRHNQLTNRLSTKLRYLLSLPLLLLGLYATPLVDQAQALPGDYVWEKVDVETIDSGEQVFWRSMTSSADGTKLAAVSARFMPGGYIYTSVDSGATWTPAVDAGERGWFSITSSADGTKLAAVDRGGYIYTSVDSGATWTPATSAGERNWQFITYSTDNTTLAATWYDWSTNEGSVLVSDNLGATWMERGTDIPSGLSSVAMFDDGSRLVMATVGNGAGMPAINVYISLNQGISWVKTLHIDGMTPELSPAIAMSADGSRVAVASGVEPDESTGEMGLGSVYTSSDGGATWSRQDSAGNSLWISLVLSADGSQLIASGADVDFDSFTYTPAIYLATLEGPATDTVQIKNLGNSNPDGNGTGGSGSSTSPLSSTISKSELSITSSTCYAFGVDSVQTLSASGLTAPKDNIDLLGGLAFNISCATPGGSTPLTITLGEYYPDTSKLRIYKTNPNDPTNLLDITDQVSIQNTPGPNPTTTITYTLIDGSDFDEDNTINGVIVDPIYFGVIKAATTTGSTNSTSPTSPSGTLASTGINQYLIITAGLLVIAMAGGLVYRVRGRG